MKTTLLISLLSVWVLVGLFTYLNYYTRRRYFTIWTCAWLFYALWLTLVYVMQDQPQSPLLLMFKQWCLGVTAVFLLWGSARFLASRVAQRLLGFFMAFLFAWSYIGNFHLDPSIQAQLPIFALLGAASILASSCFLRYYRKRRFIGASLLALGFFLWGAHIASHPFIEASSWRPAGFFVSAMLQLFIAVSMIILVLEEVRETNQQAFRRIQSQEDEKSALKNKVLSTEERYRSLFDQASEGIVIASAGDLRILEINATAQRLLGIGRNEAAEFILPAFCQVGREFARAEAASWIEALFQKGNVTIVRRNGVATPAEVDGAPIDFEGAPAYQFFFREMTERARLEQQLRQAEKLSALGQMISGIAHELNNPLAVIKGYLELILAHHQLPEQTRGDLEKIAREGDRAAKLVRNFLAFAREQPARREMVNLNALVERVAELRRFDLVNAAVDLSLELQPGLPLTCADADQIQQLLLNIINNAIQATAERPPPRHLRISTRRPNENRLQIVLEDNGPGIPAELESKVFEPFFTTKAVGTGTGLGLSIAHSILSEHNGRIFHQPSPLGGAAFVLEFPITARAPAAQAPPAPMPRIPVAPGQAPAPSDVLVLDDEKSIGELLCEMLGLLGHRTVYCQTARQALEVLETRRFDLILSDYRMPVMNGREFHEQVARRDEALARRIIFLTGDVVNEETQAFLKHSGNLHLPKPFQLATLQEAVEKVLAASQESGSALGS